MQGFDVAELVPRGFVVESATRDDGGFVIGIRVSASVCRCPMCGSVCSRVHSQYRRRLADLPAAGVRIALILRTRRFFCDIAACERRIFAERFETAEPRARRTSRLDDVVHCLAIALGGRPAASLSRRLNVEVSNDTLLRMVRRRGSRSFPPPTIVGIDDWAWRRNHRYGTLVCDLERHATIALLPDREPATAEAWLAQQSQICVVARDRGGGYGAAAQRALPHAIQVADRWHLMENASGAFLDAVRKSMRQIRAAMGTAMVDPSLLTFAEKLQVRGVRTPRGDERRHPLVVPARDWDQGDRAPHRVQPRTDPKNSSRTALGRLPCPATLPRALSSLARRAVGRRLPK